MAMFVTSLLLLEVCWQVIQDLPAYFAYSPLYVINHTFGEKVTDVRSPPSRFVTILGVGVLGT